MAVISFTPEQRRAIEATGRSVIVTAAAGSGKTAVLSERCAYLACDAPLAARCDVDELLVLTFTEAAAAEMRGRIVEAIQERQAANSADARLREQVALTDAAQISTIHAFCLRLIRRWFTEADIDPGATLLDEHEATLLRREVLEALFEQRYEPPAQTDPPLGTIDDAVSDVASRLETTFARLVDVYGLENDREIGGLVLELDAFVSSLAAPDEWLNLATSVPRDAPDQVVLAYLETLPAELDRQIDHCDTVTSTIDTHTPAAAFVRERIVAYADQLRAWRTSLLDAGAHDVSSGRLSRLTSLDRVCHEIKEFAFTRKTGPRLSKDADDDARAAKEEARRHYDRIKNSLFKKRLRQRYALFSLEEWRDGMRRIAPFVATIVTLVRRFRRDYVARKQELNVLDFSDLERLAHRLLSDDRDRSRPSAIARSLHEKFAYVLVDEFQDVNPLQQEILRLVSHESSDDRPGNLFVVGDVKQSIYRFRLAEPDLFIRRVQRFRRAPAEGEAIALQQNFRSRAHLLDAVNDIFRVLMPPGSGAIVYDRDAALRPGRPEPATPVHPIELHVIERQWSGIEPDEDEDEDTDSSDSSDAGMDRIGERRAVAPEDPSIWTPIEREGHLIGRCIQAWMREGVTVGDERSLEYRDVAVLLRAATVNAERIAAMLTSMNIPAFAAVGGSLFAALEIRDVLALLRVLDNGQQDIPLAAVLRSGILGGRFTEHDLLTLRLLDRNDAFHRVVRRYPAEGRDSALRERVADALRQIEQLRIFGQCAPPADLLWRIYDERGHLAFCCGLPGGEQRRANLLKFHELARQFGSFRRQGLARFMRFIEGMSEEDERLSLASSIGESENVVRVLSIHKSKGLEFPVVFVAGLGNRFNLGDRSGRMIYARHTRIGLRVVDTEKMIEYPSASHAAVVEEIEREARAEEMRILYVAMTRARDRLVLVGSRRRATGALFESGPTPAPRPSSHAVYAAATPLDWLVPTISGTAQPVRFAEGDAEIFDDGKVLYDVRLHTPTTMASWRTAAPASASGKEVREAVAALAPLPASEPTCSDDAEVEAVQARLDFVYPFLSTSSVRATIAASEHKGLFDFAGVREASIVRDEFDLAFAVPPSKYQPAPVDSGIRRGTMTHRVLEHLDFGVARDAAGVASELQRLTDAGILRAADLDAIDEPSLVWFVATPLAAFIRKAGDGYRRELRYIAAEPPTSFDSGVETSADDFVLVRGVVDGILPIADGVEVIDFKTDRIGADDVVRRAERYRPQMSLYARAVTRLVGRSVTACRLVFLAPRQIVSCPIEHGSLTE